MTGQPTGTVGGNQPQGFSPQELEALRRMLQNPPQGGPTPCDQPVPSQGLPPRCDTNASYRLNALEQEKLALESRLMSLQRVLNDVSQQAGSVPQAARPASAAYLPRSIEQPPRLPMPPPDQGTRRTSFGSAPAPIEAAPRYVAQPAAYISEPAPLPAPARWIREPQAPGAKITGLRAIAD
jgi:hypothetical protein